MPSLSSVTGLSAVSTFLSGLVAGAWVGRHFSSRWCESRMADVASCVNVASSELYDGAKEEYAE